MTKKPALKPQSEPAALPEAAVFAEEILVEGCRPNPWNKERPLDPAFVESIRKEGVISPILVRPIRAVRGPAWEVIAGARRLAASKEVGRKSIGAVVRDVDDATAKRLTLAENVNRVGLSAWQEAEALAELLEVCSAQEAAESLGWPAWRVRRRAKLLNLSKEWKEALQEEGSAVRKWPAAWLEEVVVLPHEMQDDLLDEIYSVDDFDDLKREISSLTELLRSAPFDITNATLCPKAGACTNCQKRTGAQPDLFPDEVTEAKAASDDRCLDRECWSDKAKAHQKAKIAAVRAKHGDIPFVSTDTYPTGTMRSKFPGLIGAEQYTKAKKSDAGAVQALAVSGINGELAEPRIVYMIPKSAKASNAADKAAGKAAPVKSMEEQRAGLETRRWSLVGQKLQVILGDNGKVEVEPPSLAALAVAATVFGISSTDDITGDDWEQVDELLTESNRAKDLFLECVCRKMSSNLQYARDGVRAGDHEDLEREILQVCKFFGIDSASLKAAADTEIPEPKSWGAQAAAEAAPKQVRKKPEKLTEAAKKKPAASKLEDEEDDHDDE